MTRLIDAEQFGVISLQGKSEEFIEGVKFMFDKIHEAPTVERPHGEWIPKAVHNCWTRFECSVCGYYHEPVHDFGESKPNFNFCPNCGADMRKEGDENGTGS